MKHKFLSRLFSLGFLLVLILSTAGCNSTSSGSTSLTSTTTAFASSSYSATAGADITLSVTVSPTAATGTVTFYDTTTSTTLCSSAALSSGVASCTASFSAVETHTVKATYSGDSTYATSYGTASVVVSSSSSGTTTTTAFASSSYSATAGSSITLSATVSPSAATGTVTFYDTTTSTTLCSSVTLSSGAASCDATFSAVETDTVKATYSGDSTYASSSGTATVTVAASSSGTSTTTALTTSSATAYPGSLVILTATMSTTAATGSVTFYAKTSTGSYSSLGSATLSSGVATLNTHFSSANTYTVEAIYGGDSTYASSTSSTITETVAKSSYSLDLSDYTVLSSSGTYNSVSVTYNYYSNVVYAADPVSSSYESMNIFIPTKIGSTSVSDMPILLEICVGGYMSCQAGSTPATTNGTYAMAKGYVVVEVGCRGRDNGSSGNYYGVAPAAMVDLKAAVRYLRYNSSLGTSYFTGDVDHIIDSGGSAGGALASLLGASGNSSLYDTYLAAIGAADADDNIFAVGAWSPITNLDHADGAYEMEYGSLGSVNSTISSDLISIFDDYQDGLALADQRGTGYGTLTHSNITDYILVNYMEPSLEKYVKNGGSAPSYATCTASSSSTYGYTCTFSFSNYVSTSVGSRGKDVPAFDSFFDNGVYDSYSSVNTSCSAESVEFGSSTGSTSSYSGTNCSSVDTPRHFTNFSSEKMTGSDISTSMQTLVNMMNPMYFLMKAVNGGDSSGVAKYWYIRDGTIATDTSAYVIVDLATAVENLWGTSYVNAWEDWATGHNVNTDASGFSSWVTASVATN